MTEKKALITGVTGQDGSYLAELLLKKGYQVYGLVRRTSAKNTDRIDHLLDNKNLFLQYGDLTDASGLIRLMIEIKPDEVYNLGAQSHVGVSFETPEYTAQTDALGILRLLEAVRIAGLASRTKIYQASTSELYGETTIAPQSEETPFNPSSPYAVAKLYAYWIVKNYRVAYKMFAVNGILFNHESPRRGETFVTRKITIAVAQILCGLQETLLLGNLDSKRDWGYAPEYVEAMWLMLQQEKPEDFVIATGRTTTVRQFVEYAFAAVGIKIRWHGVGVYEKGFNAITGKELIAIDPQFFRPSEVPLLLGDATKAEKNLGWKAQTSVEELVQIMVDADLESVRKQVSFSKNSFAQQSL